MHSALHARSAITIRCQAAFSNKLGGVCAVEPPISLTHGSRRDSVSEARARHMSKPARSTQDVSLDRRTV